MIFQGVRFQTGGDIYDVKVVYNATAETLAMEFTSWSSRRVYSRVLSKQHIATITTRCQLSPSDLYNLLTDQLGETECIRRYCRLYKCADATEAGRMCADLLKMDSVPDHHGGAILDTRCILFVLHYAPSQYVHCNYCFMIQQRVSEHSGASKITLLEIRKLRRENEGLKIKLKTVSSKLTSTESRLARSYSVLRKSEQSAQKLLRRVMRLEKEKREQMEMRRKRNLSSSSLILSNAVDNRPSKKARREYTVLPQGLTIPVEEIRTGKRTPDPNTPYNDRCAQCGHQDMGYFDPAFQSFYCNHCSAQFDQLIQQTIKRDQIWT